MKIANFRVISCVQANTDPEWRSALGANAIREGWLLELTTDTKLSGYGYAPASRHLGTTHKTVEIELNTLAPIAVGEDPFNIEPILSKLDRKLVGANASKGAIDCALHDLAAQAAGIPLCQLLGGSFRTSIPMIRILPLKSPSEMAEEAQILVGEGYQYLKIKVDGDIDQDIARVKTIRKAIGANIHLTIDANQAYTTKGALYAINHMCEFGIDLVEQPVNARDFTGLKLITDSVPVDIEADESAGSIADVSFLIAHRIVDAISLRLPNLGGLRRTLAVARMCEAASINYRLGAAVGPRLLAAQSLHLAVGLPNLKYACELAEFEHLTDDPFTGLEVTDGMLTLPSGIGSGVRFAKP